jgi:hypothetical protein
MVPYHFGPISERGEEVAEEWREGLRRTFSRTTQMITEGGPLRDWNAAGSMQQPVMFQDKKANLTCYFITMMLLKTGTDAVI